MTPDQAKSPVHCCLQKSKLQKETEVAKYFGCYDFSEEVWYYSVNITLYFCEYFFLKIVLIFWVCKMKSYGHPIMPASSWKAIFLCTLHWTTASRILVHQLHCSSTDITF